MKNYLAVYDVVREGQYRAKDSKIKFSCGWPTPFIHNTVVKSDIGKETTLSKQVIQFHCFEKWTKNQRVLKVVSNQRIKKQSFKFTDA